jgi:hypothetical protein
VSLAVRSRRGPGASPRQPTSRLRIAVFAERPRFCNGDAARKAGYLGKPVAATGAMLVAGDGMPIVRAATARPMTAQDADFRAGFEARAIGIARLCCAGESLLLAKHRGRRIAHTFWRKRGYAPVEGPVAAITWKEHAEADENPEPIQCRAREF